MSVPQHRIRLVVVVAMLLATGVEALAWASMWFPGVEDVHQRAIHLVLGGKLPKEELNGRSPIEILTDRQSVMDQKENQVADQSHLHAMTGIKRSDSPAAIAAKRLKFIRDSESLVQKNLLTAITERRKADETPVGDPKAREAHLIAAYERLGDALHTMQDATSPAHELFQPWPDGAGLFTFIRHGLQENHYPDDDKDADQCRSLARLEGAVRFAYAIFLKPELLPAKFFDQTKDGELILPPEYLTPR